MDIDTHQHTLKMSEKEKTKCHESCYVYIEEDDEIVMNEKCLDCEFSEIDDIYHELSCKKHRRRGYCP